MPSFRMIEPPELRRELLRLARRTASHEFGDADSAIGEQPAVKGRAGGVFVTFWHGKTLRGCIGTFVPTQDIAATIQEVTRLSLKDSRFVVNPITAAELPDLTIEISVLSDPAPTDDPCSLVPGRHGIIVQRGTQSGCFLPKVATERGWSAEEFLSSCCTMKAGLSANAWQDSETEVLLFEADAFAESEFANNPGF